ncbi:MAG: hypothetical protein KF873_16840, partial [Gemmataceae bacterium]|nr:hypothetical protein [Gemmataceae bacterium]
DIIISGGMRDEPNTFDCGGLTISSGECDALDWDELSLINLSLIGCVIHDLYLPKTPPLGIRLEKCYIVTVRGATGPAGLPGWIVDPDIEIFDPTGNSSALMQLDASLTVRLGLTILQKVYKQRGSGRKQNAFSRGVDPVAVKYVPAVLRVLESERLLVPSEVKTETIWRGVPEKRPRVEGILSAAGRGDDPIIHMLDAIV